VRLFRGGVVVGVGMMASAMFGLANHSMASGVSSQTNSLAWGTEPAITVGTNPVEIAAGANGSIWVVDSTDATLTEIADVNGVATAQQPVALASGSRPTGVTVDQSGNVWVGLSGTGQVQQLLNDGGMLAPQTPISVGRTNSTMNLRTAPDGSIWVVFRDTADLQHIVFSGGAWSTEPMLSADRGIDELIFDTNGTGWLMHPSDAITKLSSNNGTWSLSGPLSATGRTNWGTPGPNGSLYISDGGCAVYELEPNTGTRLRGQGFGQCDASSIATTPDSSIWLTSPGAKSVYRWSSTSFSQVETFFVGGDPRDLTASSDGSMWFVNVGTKKVQKIAKKAPIASTITSASSLTSAVASPVEFLVTTGAGFPTPAIRTFDPLPYGLSLNDNRNGTATIVGSAQNGTQGVYAITIEAVNGDLVTTQDFTLTVPGTAPNTLTVFARGAGGGWSTCEVNSMTSTANGTFWVASPSGNILRYTGAANLAENMNVGGRPSQIVTATDGTVWYIDETNNNVRSISNVNGVWTLDSTVTVGSSPRFLTAGADGSVWVADTVDDTVKQITNVGGQKSVSTTLSFSLANLTFAGLTKGLDGSIWAVDRTSGSLLRIFYDVDNAEWNYSAPLLLDRSNTGMVLAPGPGGDVWIAFRDTSTLQSVKNVNGVWTVQSAITAPFNIFTIVAGPRGTLLVGDGSGVASQLAEIEGTWRVMSYMQATNRTQYATATDSGSLWWSDGGCALHEWKSYEGVAPAITSAPSGVMPLGSNSTLTLTATGSPNVTFSKVGTLPAGVSFNVDSANSRATLSGQPSDSVTPGDYTVKIIADNGAYRAAVQMFTLTVSVPATTTTTEPPTTSTEAPPTVPDTAPPSSGAPGESPNTSPSTNSTEAPSTTVASTMPVVAPPAASVVVALPVASTPLVTDASVSAGAEVNVTFGGFVPGEFVQLIVASTPQVIGSGYANAQGFVTLSGNIPSNLTSGNHTLAVYAPDSGTGFKQPITVAGPKLPATGSEPNRWLEMGMWAVIAGAVLTTRRRRQPS